jgi:hypothetical protein
VALSCLGISLKGSGAESIFVESGTFGVNVVGCPRWKELHYVIEGVTVIEGVIITVSMETFFREGDNAQEQKEQLVDL